jgi:hypothetical protein
MPRTIISMTIYTACITTLLIWNVRWPESVTSIQQKNGANFGRGIGYPRVFVALPDEQIHPTIKRSTVVDTVSLNNPDTNTFLHQGPYNFVIPRPRNVVHKSMRLLPLSSPASSEVSSSVHCNRSLPDCAVTVYNLRRLGVRYGLRLQRNKMTRFGLDDWIYWHFFMITINYDNWQFMTI